MIIEPDILIPDLFATSKKHLMVQVAERAAKMLNDSTCTNSSILDAMLEREKIGSTAIGDGVAIPHVRLACLDRCVSALIRLKSPINFDAADGRDVDLVYVFMAPENPDAKTASLMQLARISHFFRDAEFCDMLRHSNDMGDLIRFRNGQLLEAA